MNTALYRWYTNNNRKVKALQGKVFSPEGKLIYYRDFSEHKGRLWMSKGSWNIDYRTFLWLQKNGVKEIHYFWEMQGKLFITSVRKVAKWLKEGRLKVEFLNGHRQIFLPKGMFRETVRNYHVFWIKKETDAGASERRIVEDFTIPVNIKLRLAEEFRRKYA